MADDIYVVDLLATGIPTIVVTDDGTGSDWLEFQGVYPVYTTITLAWTFDGTSSSGGSGFYFNPGNNGHRLVVNGIIENVRGANSDDFIGGNELANIIFGDNAETGVGGNDTINSAAGDDTVYGGSGDDGIIGAAGDDMLMGDSGNDTITGNDGVDTVEGGAGADSLSGGSTNGDTLTYAHSGAGVQVLITYGTATTGAGGDAEGDRIVGFTNVIGSDFNDIISDTILGTISFGYNDNQFSGGAGKDSLLLGGGNDTGIGGSGNDFLLGGIGDDDLYGGTNNDNLRGSKGQDTLTGGNGADVFEFKTANDSTVDLAQRDTITDFSTAEHDQIDLSAIDAEARVPGNQAFHFITTGFKGNVGELRARLDGADMVVLGDINGDRIADFAILVQGISSLGAGDFNL
jgi:serralysin